MPDPSIPIEDQIRAVAREVALRKSVYAKRVEAGKMKADEARAELDAMKAVGRTLVAVRDAEPLAVALLAAIGYDTDPAGEPPAAGPSTEPPADPPASDAVSDGLCAKRLELVDSADAGTLNRWFEQARDAWPEPQRTRLMEAIRAEAARRNAEPAYADGKPPKPALQRDPS